MANNLFLNAGLTGASKVKADLRGIRGTMKQVTAQTKTMATGNKKLGNSFVNLNKDVNRNSVAMGNLSKVMRGLNFAKLIGSMYVLSRVMGGAIEASMDMIETQNLFNVSMGETAVSTGEYLDNMSSISGLDLTNLKNTVGTYSLLARSMGFTSEQSATLSKTVNNLALDLASLTNVPIAQAMQDLRSGLLGQSETVYKYGIDVTEASIKTEAMRQGIEKSVRQMSQGEKMALRYAVMIRQTGLSHGDFANTINQPANQIRILKERFVTLTRVIGDMFIPILGLILPYANAVVIVLTRLFTIIGKFLGAKPIENENTFGKIGSDAEDAGTSIGGVGKAVGKATDKLKEMRKYVMGFDELNIIPEQTKSSDSGGSGGGGGGIGGGSILDDMDLSMYDNMLSNIKQKSDELLKSVEDGLKRILIIVGLIAIGFLAWKISNGIYALLTAPSVGVGLLGLIKGLGTKLGILNSAGGLASMVALAGIIFIMIVRFVDLVAKSEKFRKGLVVLKDIGVAVFNFIGDVIDETIVLIKQLTEGIWDLIPKSAQDAIKNFFDEFGNLVGYLDLDFADLLLTLAGIGLLFTPLAPFGVALLAFEAITVAIRALGYGATDVIDEIDWLGTGISEVTLEKLEPFREKMNEVTETLNQLDWGNIVIDDAILGDVQSKLSEVTRMILSELDSDKNEALANLKPLEKALGKEAFDQLIEANTSYYDEMIQQTTDNEEDILEIVTKAKEENRALTEEESKQINLIRDAMNDTGLKHIAETEVEYNKIMNTLKDNSERISLEQASSIIKNSKETMDETIDNANTQYSQIELEAKRMHEVGKISDEEYANIMKSAKDAKDDTIKSAKKQYEDIHKATVDGLGETAKYIDTTNGEIKSKWDVWSTNFVKGFKDTWKSVKDSASETWENLKTGSSEAWEGIKKNFSSVGTWFHDTFSKAWQKVKDVFSTGGKIFDGIKDGIAEAFKNVVNRLISGINRTIAYPFDKLNSALNTIRSVSFLGISPFKGLWNYNPISVPSIPRLARGGVVEGGGLFQAGEFGKAEMVGSYGGKTTVMPLENTGFVNAIEKAVARGLGGSQGSEGIVVNIGGKTLVDILGSEINRQSRINGKAIINV